MTNTTKTNGNLTSKSTKSAMVTFLTDFSHPKMSKALKDSITYALKLFNKNGANVKQTELYSLIEQCRRLDGNVLKADVVPMEALKKPVPKKTKEEVADKELEPAEPVEPKKKGAVKKPLKKQAAKVETVPALSTLGTEVEFATSFPTEIEHEEIGTLVRVPHNMYTTYKEVYKALVEEEKTIYIAGYWPKRMIKKYNYANAYRINPSKVKNGFDNDLDLINCVLPLETEEYVYAMSLYTEALYCFYGEDFKPLVDKDPRSGEEFSIRISAGLEFELYMLADEM